jgi:hypothetical protein
MCEDFAPRAQFPGNRAKNRAEKNPGRAKNAQMPLFAGFPAMPAARAWTISGNNRGHFIRIRPIISARFRQKNMSFPLFRGVIPTAIIFDSLFFICHGPQMRATQVKQAFRCRIDCDLSEFPWIINA